MIFQKFKVALVKKIRNKNGMSTIEVIFLVAVLMGLAILFGSKIKEFASKTMDELTDDKLFDKVDPGTVLIDSTGFEHQVAINKMENGTYELIIKGDSNDYMF